MADSSLTPLQLLLLMPRHEHSVTVRPDSGTHSVEKGPFLLPFLPIIAKVIATLLFRRMSNQKLNEARIGLLCCSILEMEVSSF